jgi:hypothetical protein
VLINGLSTTATVIVVALPSLAGADAPELPVAPLADALDAPPAGAVDAALFLLDPQALNKSEPADTAASNDTSPARCLFRRTCTVPPRIPYWSPLG